MPDHVHYEELTALAAGGHLTPPELDELRAHLSACDDCRESGRAYRDIVAVGLPLTRDAAPVVVEAPTAVPDGGARDRFLARARREGLRFSAEVHTPSPSVGWSARARIVAGLAVAAALVAAVLYRPLSSAGPAHEDLNRLQTAHAELNERLSARDREIAAQQDQLRALRAELDAAQKAAGAPRPAASTSQAARLGDELQNREKQLAAASEEIGRINQLRGLDRAALAAQEARLRDAFDQLRVATATLEMERQLAAAGKDLLDLVRAKQLRVVDVRDTDPEGRASPAFARVFVAEDRSLRIFAFDLNTSASRGPMRFRVWAELGDARVPRSLGVLDVDDRTQNRWSLTIEDAAVVRNIDSVFVTASARENAPEGPRLLYAQLAPPATP